MEEWSKGLSGLSGDDIKRGLEVCRTEFDWPPTIAEFVKASKPQKTAAYHKLFKLPKPPVNTGKAKIEMQQIKRILRHKKYYLLNAWQSLNGMRLYV